MPVNTQDALDPRGRNQIPASTGTQRTNLDAGAGDAAAAQRIAAQRNAILSGAGDAAAAQAFIAERDARLSGAGDEAAAQAIIADRASNSPAPSTVQATNAAPTGSTSPSLAGRTNSSFSTLSPRPYFRIDPLDNRYDFLTGQKINTIRGNPNVAAPSPGYSGGNTTGGTGVNGTQGSTEVSNQTFYNDFGDSYTQADRDSVEQLRSFNEDLGGGAARSQLTAGERAYAIQQGYIS